MAQTEQAKISDGLAGKLFALKRLGMSDDELSQIRDNQSADIALNFLNDQKKSEAKKDVNTQAKTVKLNESPIPPTDQQIRENMESNPVSFEELNDPRQPDEVRLNLLNGDGRIIKMYSDEFPNGGIF
jgi:hypothetical protein